jgi:hypothetical protein
MILKCVEATLDQLEFLNSEIKRFIRIEVFLCVEKLYNHLLVCNRCSLKANEISHSLFAKTAVEIILEKITVSNHQGQSFKDVSKESTFSELLASLSRIKALKLKETTSSRTCVVSSIATMLSWTNDSAKRPCYCVHNNNNDDANRDATTNNDANRDDAAAADGVVPSMQLPPSMMTVMTMMPSSSSIANATASTTCNSEQQLLFIVRDIVVSLSQITKCDPKIRDVALTALTYSLTNKFSYFSAEIVAVALLMAASNHVSIELEAEHIAKGVCKKYKIDRRCLCEVAKEIALVLQAHSHKINIEHRHNNNARGGPRANNGGDANMF